MASLLAGIMKSYLPPIIVKRQDAMNEMYPSTTDLVKEGRVFAKIPERALDEI